MLSKNRVLTFLKKKEALNPCDACGKSLWQVPSNNVDKTLPFTCNLLVEPGHWSENVQTSVMQTVVAVCMNCAHIRFFSANGIGVADENK